MISTPTKTGHYEQSHPASDGRPRQAADTHCSGLLGSISLWDAAAILLLSLLGLLVNGPNGNAFGYDMAFYLAGAETLKSHWHVSNSVGDPEWQRFGFYWLLRAVQDVFGRSLSVVAWAVSFFSAAFVVTVYAVGRVMFGRLVAISAATTFLLSSAYIYYSSWHIDAVWPTFLLGSVALLAATDNECSIGRGALAGALAAIAFVIKETAIFFLIVPLLWHITEWKAISWRTVVAFYLVVGTILCFWTIAVFVPAINANVNYQTPASVISQGFLDNWPNGHFLLLLRIGAFGLWDYFFDFRRWSIAEAFPILPILGIVGAVTLARGLVRSGSLRLAALCLLAYVPLVSYVGYLAMRPSQVLFVNAILLICFFALLGEIISVASRVACRRTYVYRGIAFISSVAFLVLVQALFGVPGMKQALGNSLLMGILSGEHKSVYLPGSEVANYLAQNAKPSDEVACVEEITCNSLAWHAPQLRRVPVPQNFIAAANGWSYSYAAPSDSGQRPISISSSWRSSFKASKWESQGTLLILYEQPLLHCLTRPDLRYVVVESNSQYPNLVDWLDQTKGLTRVITADRTRGYDYVVYRRTTTQLAFPENSTVPLLTADARQFFSWLIERKNSQNSQYHFFSRRLPGAAMGRTLEDLLEEPDRRTERSGSSP